MANINKNVLNAMYNFVLKKGNLADYMETDAGCILKWYEPGISAGTICPLPDHSDKKPSFRIKYCEDTGIWIFHCFGCHAKGNIIDFCRKYHGLKNSLEAVKMLCKKFDFKDENINDFNSINDVVIKKFNLKKKIEYANIISSNSCRILLRKNYEKFNKWVSKSYKKINTALENDDLDTVEMIVYEADKKGDENK